METSNRRTFLQAAGLSTLTGMTIPEIAQAAFKAASGKQVKLEDRAIILFQGDSITDAGRDKKSAEINTPAALGSGYAMLSASKLLLKYPGKDLKFSNKGTSGNKVFQLRDRWDAECVQLKPDILSILIGVNDFWAVKKHGYEGTIDTYRTDFKLLLQSTIKSLPDVKLIIGEPFAIKGVSAVDESWYPEFDKFRQAARALADEFNAGFIPYQTVFDEAIKSKPGTYWTADGVHPSLAGAALMSEAWLAAIK